MRPAVFIGAVLILAVAGWSSCGDSDEGGVPERSQLSGNVDYGANSRLEPPASEVDPDIEFPKALSELPDLPQHLAVDPVTGDLWFVMFSYGGDNTLYHYRATDGTIETRSIPASSSSSLFSDIAVDSQGRVISAEGNQVLMIDSEGGDKEMPLPEPVNFAKQVGFDGTYVIDMELSKDGKAYLTRMNVAAVTELDLSTGESRELPVPASLGQFYYISLSGDELWMTTWATTAVAPSQTAVIDLATGETTLTALKSTDLVADGGTAVYAGGAETPGLARIDATTKTAVPIVMDQSATDLARQILVEPDYLALDADRGKLWVAGVGRNGIASLDLSTGATDHYFLPSWKGGWISVPIQCQYMDCRPPGGGSTAVGDLAVAPNGDVFFSDQSFNRIGIVHPR